jgi:hypothetical protein
MSRELSVLQTATAGDVQLDPYPYLVIPNALPEKLYRELEASFPSPESLGISSNRSNSRWNYAAYRVRANSNLPKIWSDFIAYHSSQAFFEEIANLFYEGVHALYPDRYPTKESLTGLRAGVREDDSFPRHDVLMDAMISGNTPVTEASSVRTSHVDRGDKLFSGLFYMRPASYDAVGGDLTISRFKPEIADAQDRYAKFSKSSVDDRYLDVVRTVRYDRNLLVLFVNSLESVHGVTVRQPSSHSRLFVNLVGEIENRLYETEVKGAPARYVPKNHRAWKILTSRWMSSLRKAIG